MEGEIKMTLKDAKELWDSKYPDTPITFQTLRNWARKFGFGEKKNFLPRSEWIIIDDLFNQFLSSPESYLNAKEKQNENN